MDRNVISRRRVYTRKKVKVSINDIFYASKKKIKQYNFFCYSLLLFIFSIVTANTPNRYFTPVRCQAIEIVALLLLFIASFNLIRFKFENKYLAFVFPVYFIYCMTIVARGFKFDYNSLKYTLLSTDFGILTYIAPLAILMPKNLEFYKRFFNTVFIVGILFIFYVALYFKIAFDRDWFNENSKGMVEGFFITMAFALGFIALTIIYYTPNKRILALFVLALNLYLVTYRARRGAMLLSLTNLTAAGIVYFVYTKKKAMVIVLSMIMVVVGVIFLSNTNLGVFKYLEYRGKEDTRTGVEEWMKDDMSNTDWIIGKGLSGTYYTPIIIDGDSNYRYVVETGYLQVILKGGIVSLGLLLLILIPAVIKGLFQSKNILSVGAAAFILLWILYLYPVVPTGFTMYYILVWISAGICYSKKIRYLSNATIKEYLGAKESIWYLFRN